MRLSKEIEKLENRAEGLIKDKWKQAAKKLAGKRLLLLAVWYFLGMLINSIDRSVFGRNAGKSLWEWNPILNLAAVFTPAGLGVLFFCGVMAFLYSKKGYRWFSGYKAQHDSRGFDILPDGTHGTGGWMGKKEMEAIFEIGMPDRLAGTILGKLTEEENAQYVTPKPNTGLNQHFLIYGASGTGKSRGFVKPFLMQAVRRGESVVTLDPKGELYEMTAGFAKKHGAVVRVYNLLDMENSDGFNCISDLESDKSLVQSVAQVIIRNTSNASEKQDFWEKAEMNLLMAMLHYVADMRDGSGRLLPIEKRSLGEIYKILSSKSITELEILFDKLKRDFPSHPALAPFGIFKQANRAIWGNIAIGLGNRLSVFQNKLVDTITRYNDIDLTLPGRVPCVYYCIISAQDSSLEFLSSMFFSLMFTRLADYARRFGSGGRLPVTVNMLLDEFCNCGSILDFKKILSVCRSQGVNCQLVIQGLAQLSDRYDHNQWEEIVGNIDTQLFLGCNDKMTADYVSAKCSTVTIRTTTSTVPMRPLFSPVYANSRSGSEGRQNIRRELMMPDELMALDNRKCIALVRGQKPLMLYKIAPEELPAAKELEPVRITDYRPGWRDLEDRAEQEKSPEEVTQEGTPPPEDILQYITSAKNGGAPQPREEPPTGPDFSGLGTNLTQYDYSSGGYRLVSPDSIRPKRKD